MQPGPYDNDFDTLALRAIAAAGYNTKRHVDKKDYGPRIGFAYDVSGDGKTVIRGGYGLYYDELFQNITLYERWSDVRTPLFFVLGFAKPVDAGLLRRQPRCHSHFVHRPDLRRPGAAYDGPRPDPAEGARVQRGRVPPVHALLVDRLRLHPLDREGRDTALADQHCAERQHPALTGRGVRAGPRRLHRRRQLGSLAVRWGLPHRQGEGGAGPGADELRVDEGHGPRRFVRDPAVGHQ